MIGIAAGLALAGRRVFVYSISKFIAGKCFEQIREDVCFHGLPVTFIGAGAGFGYGFAGFSHFCIDDIGILRQIPGICIYSPCDNYEAERVFWKVMERREPAYIRIGKKEKDSVLKNNDRLFSDAYFLKRGKSNIVIVSYGTIMSEVMLANEYLLKDGIDVSIVSCPVVSPVNIEFFKANLSDKDKIFVVEEHYSSGGLGEILDCFNPIKISVPQKIMYIAGSEDYMRHYSGIDAVSIVGVIEQSFES
jgi:transketolase